MLELVTHKNPWSIFIVSLRVPTSRCDSIKFVPACFPFLMLARVNQYFCCEFEAGAVASVFTRPWRVLFKPTRAIMLKMNTKSTLDKHEITPDSADKGLRDSPRLFTFHDAAGVLCHRINSLPASFPLAFADRCLVRMRRRLYFLQLLAASLRKRNRRDAD